MKSIEMAIMLLGSCMLVKMHYCECHHTPCTLVQPAESTIFGQKCAFAFKTLLASRGTLARVKMPFAHWAFMIFKAHNSKISETDPKYHETSAFRFRDTLGLISDQCARKVVNFSLFMLLCLKLFFRLGTHFLQFYS